MYNAAFLILHPLSNSPLSAFDSNHFSFSYTVISSFPIPKLQLFRKPPKYNSLHSIITASITKHPESLPSLEALNPSDVPIKMPIAPWQEGPLLHQPIDVLDLFRERKKKKKKYESGGPENIDRSLTEKIRGVRGPKAMKQIVRSISKLQENCDSDGARESSSEFELRFLLKGIRRDERGDVHETVPWSKPERVVIPREKRLKVPTVAEKSLDAALLERLRIDATEIRKWVKVKKCGVTQSNVDEVKSIWRNNELVMLKFDVPLCLNMKRAYQIVETLTGGLVVWSKKKFLVVYRGCQYRRNCVPSVDLPDMSGRGDEDIPLNGSLYEREADRLLDALGPRFINWWRSKPLPVDGDLLPEVVPGFMRPSRACPRNARRKLADIELTKLRRFSKTLPTHFVVGRNKNLQGLAAAILKLWEKCNIAKIAVKWGSPNAKNKLMANELKNLTGGVLILRNKFIIIIYRGKDFIPSSVAKALADRRIELANCQLHEETTRPKIYEDSNPTDAISGTLSEFQTLYEKHGNLHVGNPKLEVEKEKIKNELRHQEHKLFILMTKIKKSEKVLTELNHACQAPEQELDKELLTEEERECLRKIGMKMDRCLMLGRRGVFDGVMEGIHQHWKFREVVKIITKQKQFSRVVLTARSLESESGGNLVSIDAFPKGFAIILYRGKNYRRPLKVVRGKLLTKREALRRSLELQRCGSLKFFAYQRRRAIADLRNKWVNIHKNCSPIEEQ